MLRRVKITTGKVRGSSFAHNDILAASDSLHNYACLPSLPWQLLLSVIHAENGLWYPALPLGVGIANSGGGEVKSSQ